VNNRPFVYVVTPPSGTYPAVVVPAFTIDEARRRARQKTENRNLQAIGTPTIARIAQAFAAASIVLSVVR
jgi:hypothetical protein